MKHWLREQRHHAFTLLLLLGGLYTGYLLQQSNAHDNYVKVPDDHPDAFIEHVIAIDMDEQGNPHSRLEAPKIIHYPLDDTNIVLEPHFVVYSDDEEPWHTTAERGLSRQGHNTLQLWNNVHIHQDGGPNNRDLTMNTEALTIYPKENYVETDQPVEFIEPGTVVNAVGMHAYLKEKRIELLSNTRGVHEKQPS